MGYVDYFVFKMNINLEKIIYFSRKKIEKKILNYL